MKFDDKLESNYCIYFLQDTSIDFDWCLNKIIDRLHYEKSWGSK